MKERIKIDAATVIDLLAIKHSQDVFVPECKMGSSHGGMSMRMDGWAMRKSWVNFKCIGYEVKVARGDWLRDDKYRLYMPFCHEFYFVCPSGLIQVEEVPADCGLVYVSKTGTKLFTKRRAPHRDIEIDPDIYLYVLMWRTATTREYIYETSAEKCQRFVDDKKCNTVLGLDVSKKIRRIIDTKIDDLAAENCKLRSENVKLAKIRNVCKELGITNASIWDARKQVEEAVTRYTSSGLLARVDATLNALMLLKRDMTPIEPKTQAKKD